jgi:catechol 2,3-dioxygenase-like lactoylglutathione lyase family enzyme
VSLRGSPLLYVFSDVHGLPRQRELLESVLGFPVIELEPHLPHHRHGVVKYDAGNLILSLNLSSPGKFRADASDGLVTVLSVAPGKEAELETYGRLDGDLFTDPSGHHYVLLPQRPAGSPVVEELRVAVRDLDESVGWYAELLDLELVERGDEAARFATGSVDLVLLQRDTAVDGARLRLQTSLIVFYTVALEATHVELLQRGLEFGNAHPAYSDIGGTSRFDDPTGNRFCLYEPSEESLGWGSGPKVLEIAAGMGRAALKEGAR